MYRHYSVYDDTTGIAEGSATSQSVAAGAHLDPSANPSPKPVVQIAVLENSPDNQKCDSPYAAGRSQPAVWALAAKDNPLQWQQVLPEEQFAPGPGIGTNPWPTIYGDSVYLNHGYVKPIPGDFEGWGWYKIRAKHGWTELAASRTAAALIGPGPDTFQSHQSNGNWAYVRLGDAYEVTTTGTSVECAQVVIVDRDQHAGDPAKRGIVTSFGGLLPGYVLGKIITP